MKSRSADLSRRREHGVGRSTYSAADVPVAAGFGGCASACICVRNLAERACAQCWRIVDLPKHHIGGGSGRVHPCAPAGCRDRRSRGVRRSVDPHAQPHLDREKCRRRRGRTPSRRLDSDRRPEDHDPDHGDTRCTMEPPGGVVVRWPGGRGVVRLTGPYRSADRHSLPGRRTSTASLRPVVAIRDPKLEGEQRTSEDEGQCGPPSCGYNDGDDRRNRRDYDRQDAQYVRLPTPRRRSPET